MNAPIASASLYVGDLHTDVTEPMLFEIFSHVGPVASIRVCRDAVTRRSLGYAYVNFHNMVDAERALDTLNYTEIKSQPCRIMWKHRDPSIRKTGLGNVFIKNLDKQLDNRHLNDTFSAFGNIVSCKVATDDAGVSKGYGYVQYETKEEAENAIGKVNGMLICDKKVFVGHFVPKQEREKSINSDNTYTNVFVKNLPEDVEELKPHFEKYGKITSSVVMKNEEGKSKCFGFVNFDTHEAADKAVADMNGKKIGDKDVYVGRAEKKARREAEMRRKLEARRAEQQAKYQGVNLYVKNLDDSVDDEKLRTAFKEFGSITSAKVMVDEKANSKGFGFVCYETPDEATKAVTGMNGQLVGGKPIYVALHQTREVRRAQLTQQFAQRQGFGNMQRLQMMPNGHMPMFYPPGPGGPQQRPGQVFMFPQGIPPRGHFMHPQMQVQMARQGRQQGGRGGRGGAAGGAQGQRQQGQGQGQGQGQRGMKFAPNVVNQRQQNQGAAAAANGAPAPAAAPAAAGGMPELDAKALAAAPEERQKALLGEHLYMRISKTQPQLAGKITGMLLELDNTEVLHLIEDTGALDAKVNEALLALQQATGN
jgi:polyadenylate-binding protein